MKTRTLIPVTALALLLAACVAPMPTTPKLQLPGSEKPQLPLEQQTKKTNPLELPASPAQPRESVEIQVPALPADELRDFGQIRAAEEQKYSQPLPRPMLPADELRDFGQIRAAEEQKYTQPLSALAKPYDVVHDFGQIRAAEELKHSQPLPALPQRNEQERYVAMKQLYEAGYQPPNAMLSPNQLLNSAMYRYPVLRQIHKLPVLDKSGQVDRYTAMKQLYEAGYQPPNALLENIR
jgi:hypothetical protein